MRRLLIAAALSLLTCAPLALTGCVTRPAAQGPLTAHQVAARAMLTAETAFNVAATAELDAKGTGLLHGEKAAQADQLRHQAYTALLGLRAAYAAGQSPSIGGLLQLTNQLLILAGQTPPNVPIPVLPTL